MLEYCLLSDHALKSEDYYLLFGWREFFSLKGNYYLNKSIGAETKKLIFELKQLTNFITFNFFEKMYQNSNNDRRYLRPDWNIDRGFDVSAENSAKYDEYARELKILVHNVNRQYANYRLQVKKILKV